MFHGSGMNCKNMYAIVTNSCTVEIIDKRLLESFSLILLLLFIAEQFNYKYYLFRLICSIFNWKINWNNTFFNYILVFLATFGPQI